MENLTNLNHSNRTKGSQFDQVCSFINSKPIGSTYTCKELRDNCSSVTPKRLGYIHGFILYSKCIKRVKRGQYEILAHLPEFVTYNMLEANRGYTTCIKNPKYGTGTEPYYLYIPRGLKWFANEPNPYLVKQEVDLNAINQNGTTAQQEAAFKIVSLLHEGAIIQAVDTTDLRLVIIIAIVNSEARVKLKNGSRVLVPLINLKHVKVVEKFEAEEVKEEDKDRPAAAFSEAELIDKKNYILAFITDTENTISKPGSWIGRDANWAQIELAKKDLLIIEVELKYRSEKQSNPNKKEQIVNILKQGLSASDAADLILILI
jgi:hypothetical protein